MTTFSALGVLLLLILVPGFGVSFALYRPGDLALPSRLALAFGSGYAVLALVSYFLILGGVFYVPLAFGLVGAVTVAAWAVAWRRAPLVGRLRAISLSSWRDDWTVPFGLLVVAAIAVLAHPSITTFRARIPFRYWVDGMQTARLHEIPSASIHYGELYPTVSSKVFLDAFTAFVTGAIPQAELAVGPLLWMAIVGSALALFAFAREVGLRATAPLIPVVAVANPLLGHELTRDLDAYRAEPVARLVAFTALAFGVRALLGRGRMDGPVAAVLLAVSAGLHLVPTVVVCLLLGGFALGRIIAHRSRAAFMGVARRLAVVASGVLVGYALILAAPTRTGLGGPSAASEYGGYPPGFDPTAFLASGAVKKHPITEGWYRPPAEVLAAFFTQGLGVQRFERLGFIALVALVLAALALAVFALLRGREPLRYAPLACWTAGVLSMLVALYFVRRYHLHTLATVGIRRLFDYSPLLFALGGAALLELAVAPLRRVRSWAPSAAALVVVVVAIAGMLAGYARQTRADDAAAIPLLSWVRTNTPCDARLLTNSRTVGAFQAVTGRISVTEGMGPFLRPIMLRRVINLFMDARRFFRDPSGERDFLVQRGVDYVVVSRGLEIGHRSLVGAVNEQALESASFLEQVADTPEFTVYRVNDLAVAPKRLPQRFPCETTPLTW